MARRASACSWRAPQNREQPPRVNGRADRGDVDLGARRSHETIVTSAACDRALGGERRATHLEHKPRVIGERPPELGRERYALDIDTRVGHECQPAVVSL